MKLIIKKGWFAQMQTTTYYIIHLQWQKLQHCWLHYVSSYNWTHTGKTENKLSEKKKLHGKFRQIQPGLTVSVAPVHCVSLPRTVVFNSSNCPTNIIPQSDENKETNPWPIGNEQLIQTMDALLLAEGPSNHVKPIWTQISFSCKFR